MNKNSATIDVFAQPMDAMVPMVRPMSESLSQGKDLAQEERMQTADG